MREKISLTAESTLSKNERSVSKLNAGAAFLTETVDFFTVFLTVEEVFFAEEAWVEGFDFLTDEEGEDAVFLPDDGFVGETGVGI